MGKPVVSPDGVWGPRTRKAVDDFQRAYGLPLEGDVAAQLAIVTKVLKGAAEAEGGGGATGAGSSSPGAGSSSQGQRA